MQQHVGKCQKIPSGPIPRIKCMKVQQESLTKKDTKEIRKKEWNKTQNEQQLERMPKNSFCANGKEATINRVLDGSTYPSKKLVHYVFGKINYGGLKRNSLYLGLVLPSGGWQSLIVSQILLERLWKGLPKTKHRAIMNVYTELAWQKCLYRQRCVPVQK